LFFEESGSDGNCVEALDDSDVESSDAEGEEFADQAAVDFRYGNDGWRF